MLEEGLAPTEIADQLSVRWETIQSDIEILPILAKGLLSPETCARKRKQIDRIYITLYTDLYKVFKKCITDGLHKQASSYSKSMTELLKSWQLLWGLPDAKVETLGAGNFAGGKVSFTKVDVNLTQQDLEDIRSVVSRRN